MEIKKNLVDPSMYSIKCPYKMTPELIVVHNTDNDASAKNEVAYMRRNDNEVSFHFAVDDKEIWQGVPLDRNTWNAGDGAGGKGNRKGISVEICYSKSGGTRFTKAEERAAAFIAELLIERGWGLDRVTKHQDYNGKSCPKRTLSRGWSRFLAMIQAELDKQTAPAEESFFPARGYFKKGDVHENVGRIASFMRRVFPSYTNEKALGNLYGTNLIKAVKEFQRRTGLEADGYFGPLTLAMLERYGFKK